MSAVTETEHYDETVDGPVDGQPRNAGSVRTGVTNLANRAKWTIARVADFLGAVKKVVSVDATGNTITATAHGWSAAQPVRFTVVGGSLPGNVSAGTVYYVISPATDTFQISATVGGAAIDITSAGSGTIYVWPVVDAAAALFSPASGVLPAGSLRAQLSHLRDNFAKLTDPNTWQAVQTFQAAVSFLAAVTMTDLTLSGTSRLKLGSRTLPRLGSSSAFGASGFSVSTGGFATQDGVSGSPRVSWELDLPHGGTLTSVSIIVNGVTHTLLPGTKPQITVRRTSATPSSAATIGGPAVDPSGDVSAYDIDHPITISGLSHTVDRESYNYFLLLEGESGSNSLVGLAAGTPSFNCTMTVMPDR
jgi:hypothetical protein